MGADHVLVVASEAGVSVFFALSDNVMPLSAFAAPPSTLACAVLPQQVGHRRLVPLKGPIKRGPVPRLTRLLWVRRDVRIGSSLQKNPADFQLAVHRGG